MRPRRLSLCALGPFAGLQTLDFDDLQGREFFLIHGPTGAGKTTVLDAITLALYGVASGDDRTVADMRSHHAAPEVATEVSFDFDLGGQSYRVWRRPAQVRPKLRGAGTTTQPSEATLYRLPVAGAPNGEAAVLATGWAPVTGEVVGLLGFEAGQFKQVVILPQGQFRQLLLADTKDREIILEAVFGTELYRRLQERLREQALEVEHDTRQVAEECTRVLREAGVEDLAGLDELCATLDQKLQAAVAEVVRRCEEDEAARIAHTAALRVHERLGEALEAAAALERLHGRAAEVRTWRERLSRGRRALTLAPTVRTCGMRREEFDLAVAQLEEAQRRLDDAEHAVDEAEERLAKQRERESEREALELRRRELEGLRPRAHALKVAEEDARGAEEAAAEALEVLTLGRTAVSEGRDAVAGLELSRGVLLEEAARSDRLATEAGEAGVAVRRLRELGNARAGLVEAAAVFARSQAEGHAAEQRRSEARARLAEAHALFASEQAAVLARELRPGAPCPVCGATDHPAPASTTATPPDRDDLDRLQFQVEAAEAAFDLLQQATQRQGVLVAELTAAVGATTELLGPRAEVSLETLEADERTMRAAAESASASARELAQLDERLAAQRERQQDAEAELRRAEEALGVAREAVARTRAAVDAAEREVPDGLRDPDVLQQATESARRAVADLGAAFAAAEAAAHEASAQRASARARLDAGVERQREASQALFAAEAAVAAQLVEAGFVTEGEALDAACDDEVLEGLEAEIHAYDRQLHAARDRDARARAEVAGAIEPDLAATEASARAAADAARAAIECRAALRHQRDAAQSRREELGRLAERLRVLERRFALVGRLSEVATGKNEPKISFQRFVLAALFDDVAVAASERLVVMSNGRYRLERAGFAADRRRAAGLDLEVYDAYTGLSRSVSTLSGGESFLASLSLALGLADVVQTYSGGVFLETIFVDEGFGTLDQESLDLALRALFDLQRGGRLVGVISHVPELRERIDARLEVDAGRSGSSVRFVVG